MFRFTRSILGPTAKQLISVRGYQSRLQGVFGYNPKAWTNWEEIEAVSEEVGAARRSNCNLYSYINAFRRNGHKYADVNPVGKKDFTKELSRTLSPSRFGVNESDSSLPTAGLIHHCQPTVSADDLTKFLKKAYCGTIGVEFDHVESDVEREWLFQRHEELVAHGGLPTDERIELCRQMLKSQAFDHFLATKFSNVKRYGGEGAEGMMGFFVELFRNEHALKELIIGMAHRGRLNLLTGLLQFPPVAMFRKMRGLPEFPPDQYGAGDVLSHLTSSVDLPSGLHVTMLPNPSHLEAVNPVACGKTRARQMQHQKGDYGFDNLRLGEDILCVQIHGDGALSGQGVNQETLQLSQVPHFNNGGTLHLVVNNQVGFTTPGERGRSSRYCTDLAKQCNIPVIHVNGDHPEDVVKATRLAMEYHRKFRKDFFIDLLCYRKFGHNELDDPTFTNPHLYEKIQSRRNVPDEYSQTLAASGILSAEESQKIIADHTDFLQDHYKRIENYEPTRENLKAHWTGLKEPESSITHWDTGMPIDLLKYVGARSVTHPEDFAIHPHLKKTHVANRLKKLEAGTGLDWGTCEALAIGSLLYQGFNVRISGQDVGRATFSHRHGMLVDQESNEMYIPLNDLIPTEEGQQRTTGQLEIANSILSEEATLAFEYGMSIDSPKNLIIWEAQFGDFFNGAQIIFDTYIANGESKWGLQSALTILLPHGMDGAGPEHSSCRIERFLQMSDSKESAVDGDDVNWHIVHPTNAAQYFHLIRRQLVRNYRKPLVVVAPKTLLRLSAASASLNEMGPGSYFLPVIKDSVADPKKVKKVVFVSGKHYYALDKMRQERGVGDTAIVRLEQLCPFPTKELQDELSMYPHATDFVWSQEEHRNQGPWSFVSPRFRNLVGVDPRYVGRGELCQPAVGVGQVHQKEAVEVIEATFR